VTPGRIDAGPPAELVELVDAQADHFARLDRLLPERRTPPTGQPLSARLPDGRTVYGVHVRSSLAVDNPARLWAAAEVDTLTPLIGDTGTDGMSALLDAWRVLLPGLALTGQDSACMVNWPSHDVAATRAFLDHGMLPIVVIAVRRPAAATAPVAAAAAPAAVGGPRRIRRATGADGEAVVELALAELRYSALVGAPAPANGAALRADSVLRRLADGCPMWLAEENGVPVGLADCGWADVGPGSPYVWQLLAGRWGYVNCLSVAPAARGTGVGTALVRVAHAEFARERAVGSFLFYSPANPLSSVFWPRRGYRPLWTMWEVRPAAALR